MLKGLIYSNSKIKLLALSDFGRVTDFSLIDTGSKVGSCFIATVCDILSNTSYFADVGDEKVIVDCKKEELPPLGKRLFLQITREQIGCKKATASEDVTIDNVHLSLLTNKKGCTYPKSFPFEEIKRIDCALGSAIKESGYGAFFKKSSAVVSSEILFNEWKELVSRWEEAKKKAQSIKKSGLLLLGAPFELQAVNYLTKRRINYVVTSDDDFIEKYKDVFEINAVSADNFCEKHNITEAIRLALSRKVILENGANLVFDHTEALTSIDVNISGANIKDKEQAVLETNLLAVKAISEQIVLRRLGGIVVIDFINMENRENNLTVYNALKEKLKELKIISRVSKMSEFGLVELALEKAYTPLSEIFLSATESAFSTEYRYSDLFYSLKE